MLNFILFKEAKLTPKQKEILALLEKTGKSQIRRDYGRQGAALMKVIENLGKQNLLRWRTTGGWISISKPDIEPDEPGEHDLQWNLTFIIDKMSEEANGMANDIWELLKLTPGLDYHSAMNALNYGIRKNRIAKVGEWGFRVV